jgi:hypothetical protein
LGAKHLARGKVTFDVVAWDDPDAPTPMNAGETSQASVNRFKGTVLPQEMVRADGSRSESGTAWEYEDALDAQKPVWVYRRTEGHVRVTALVVLPDGYLACASYY